MEPHCSVVNITVEMQMKKLKDVGRNSVCERCSIGTSSAPPISVPSKPGTMKTARSLLSTPFFRSESLDKPGTSRGVDPIQETTTSRSTQRSTLFRKLYSIITPTQPSQSIPRAMTKHSDTISADPQTVSRPSPLPKVSASTVDPGSGPREGLIKFNNKIEKELNVEITHTLFHGGSVGCVKFSRDGKYLAAGCDDGKTEIYDVRQGTLTK